MIVRTQKAPRRLSEGFFHRGLKVPFQVKTAFLIPVEASGKSRTLVVRPSP